MALLPTQSGQLPVDPQTLMPPVQGQPSAPTQGPMQGSPQPQAAGAAALSDSPESDQTLPMPPSGGASIGSQLAAKGSPFLSNLTKGTNAAASAAGPAAAAPGGWARSLLSGAMSALGSTSGIEDSLSDAAAATAPVPPGGGAATGVLRTLQAGQQRKAQQKQQQFQNSQEVDKNKAVIAEANARMIHEQALAHQVGETAIKESIDTGTQAVAKLKSNPQPSSIIAEGLTSDELKQYITSNKLDPTKETAFPTGRKQVGENPDGTPVYRTTYTAMGLPQDVTLNPDDPKDKAQLADMNKYAPRPDGGKWGTGTQKLSGAQYNTVMGQVAEGKAQTLARDKQMLEQGMSQEKVDELKSFNMGSDWTNALNQSKGDVIGARNAIMSNPQLASKYKNLDSDITAHYPDFPKMYEDYQKKIETGIADFTKWTEKADAAKGDEAAAMAATAQSKVDDPTTPPALRSIYQQKITQLNKQSKATAKYTQDEKAAELAADTKASDGDLADLQDAALHYEMDPDKFFSKFKGLKAKQEFEAQMHRTDPTWSEGEYRARYNTKNDFRPQGKGGLAVQSINTFAGHVGDANNLIESLHNTNSPILNRPWNKIDEATRGTPAYIVYKTATQAAADNYIDFLLNQKAKHASDDDLVAQLTSPNTSPSMAQGIMRQMANTVAIKGRQLNRTYKSQMKEDIPDFLDTDTQNIFRTFGINPDQLTKGGDSGLVNKQPSTPPAGTQTAIRDPKTNQIIGYR
jgi:hypothetical protein